jgi:hypothetical protein
MVFFMDLMKWVDFLLHFVSECNKHETFKLLQKLEFLLVRLHFELITPVRALRSMQARMLAVQSLRCSFANVVQLSAKAFFALRAQCRRAACAPVTI